MATIEVVDENGVTAIYFEGDYSPKEWLRMRAASRQILKSRRKYKKQQRQRQPLDNLVYCLTKNAVGTTTTTTTPADATSSSDSESGNESGGEGDSGNVNCDNGDDSDDDSVDSSCGGDDE